MSRPPRPGSPTCSVLSQAMPLRYAVELTRAAFYAGTPGYGQVVTGRPLLDAAVVCVLIAVLMTTGTRVFNYRERTR